MEIKAIIFDCDGTLLNTTPDYLNAMNNTLIHFGLPTINEQEAHSFLGYGTDHFLTCSLKGNLMDSYEEIKKYYLDFYYKHCHEKTYPYEGVNELLKWLKKENYKIAVCSNKPDFILKEIINHIFVNFKFDYVSGQTDEYTKPDKLIFERCLNKIGCSPDEVLYLGDTEVDEKFALNSSVNKYMLVTYGFRSENYLKNNTKPLKLVVNSNCLKSEIENYLKSGEKGDNQ